MSERHPTAPAGPIQFVVAIDSYRSVPLELASRLQERGLDVRVAAYAPNTSDLRSDYPSLNITHIDSPRPADPRGWWRLARFLRAAPKGTVHVHHTFSGFLAAIIGRLMRRTVVTTQHNDLRDRGFLARLLNCATLGLSTSAVFNSHYTKSTMGVLERRAAMDRTRVVHNGVNVNEVAKGGRRSAELRSKLGIPPTAKLVGNVARLVPQKNHETLLRALHTLPHSTPETHLVIVGEGPLQGQLSDLAVNLGVVDKVTFAGMLPRGDLIEFLHAVDVFAFPSWFEGFGNALVEAMSASCAVVTSNAGAIPEVVGDACQLVSPHDDRALAETLSALLLSPGTRSDMGTRAHQRALSFDWDSCCMGYEALYRELS